MTRIVAVVVLYHPEPQAMRRSLESWLAQVDAMVCVDNGGCASLRADIEALAPGRVTLVDMGGNAGLGAAHNRGVSVARGLAATHVLLADQDSRPNDGMVAELVRVEAAALAAGHDVSAVGPRCIDPRTGRDTPFVRCGPLRYHYLREAPPGGWVVTDLLISSGSLIRMSVLDAVGPMDETLFIDQVDIEWCLRANASGRDAIGAFQATMTHQLGDRMIVIKLGRIRRIPVHKSFRYYFMFRNSVSLYRRDYAPMSWVVPDVMRLGKLVFYFGLIDSARLQNLAMMWRGLVGGLRGVTGPGPLAR